MIPSGASGKELAARIAGMNVSVIGAARSGIGVAKLLRATGSSVFVSDAGQAEKLKEAVGEIRATGAEIETGGHSDRVFQADLLVLSPGVPSNAPVVQEARRRNMTVISELELASWFCPCPIVAVTGTNGKTTTTTLIGRMFHDAKRAHAVAGNIGTAFSSVVLDLTPSSVVVLEVSSFQLDDILTFRPHIAVLLNITPDHLDRYDHSFEKYAASKSRIFEHQTMNDFLIYNADDKATVDVVRKVSTGGARPIPFQIDGPVGEGAYIERDRLMTVLGGRQSELIETEAISIRGKHNLYNAMASVLAARLSDISVPSVRATLRNFKGVEHRLEFVRERGGVQFVNDSKATNVDSVWYALQSFRQPIVLLLGGRDKGNDYSRLNELVSKHVRAIVAIGESADTVVKSFEGIRPVTKAASMEEAVLAASRLAVAGDVVLLSPACASFDWFENYEHRGRVFKQVVNGL